MVRMLSLVIILIVPSAFLTLDAHAPHVSRARALPVLGSTVTAPADALEQARTPAGGGRDGAPRAGP
jgi:hypothetical protein